MQIPQVTTDRGSRDSEPCSDHFVLKPAAAQGENLALTQRQAAASRKFGDCTVRERRQRTCGWNFRTPISAAVGTVGAARANRVEDITEFRAQTGRVRPALRVRVFVRFHCRASDTGRGTFGTTPPLPRCCHRMIVSVRPAAGRFALNCSESAVELLSSARQGFIVRRSRYTISSETKGGLTR